jgi:hypothetical protein
MASDPERALIRLRHLLPSRKSATGEGNRLGSFRIDCLLPLSAAKWEKVPKADEGSFPVAANCGPN